MTTIKLHANDDMPQAAVNVHARSVWIAKIKALIAANEWTQNKAAGLCGLSQPRISNLLRGNSSRVSLDALVNITAALERHSQRYCQLAELGMRVFRTQGQIASWRVTIDDGLCVLRHIGDFIPERKCLSADVPVLLSR